MAECEVFYQASRQGARGRWATLPEGTNRKIGWGCAARSPKPYPIHDYLWPYPINL